MSELNIELFKKIRKRIASIPASYDQSEWLTASNIAPCGAAACLAGEAIICNAPTVEQGLVELRALKRRRNPNSVIPARAAELLGLKGSWGRFCETEDEADGGEALIFDADVRWWPMRFRERFWAGDSTGAAILYLDWIIETGKVLE